MIAWSIKNDRKFRKSKKIDFWGSDLIDDWLMKKNRLHYLQSAVPEFFAKQDAEWYSAGIHNLTSRYNKCLDEQGDYVGKWEILRGIQ